MGDAAAQRAERFSLARTFQAFWSAHAAAIAGPPCDDTALPAAPPPRSRLTVS
jgi:hypothetical protein